jgi:DNA mismatch repair protein MutL
MGESMNRIHALPQAVVDMIAAGEVIERPASVARELLENALDAGARRVDVEVEGGGKDRIAVSDDGEGIVAEDLPLAVRSHATSKLGSPEDLFRITTLGFRGEALASIGAVALLRVASRARGTPSGAVIEVRGGEISDVSAAGLPEGTTVEVRKLFFNVPVRRKFLRQDSTELSYVTETVTQYALAHPPVHFRLTHAGREVLDAPPAADPLRRIEALHGTELAAALVPVVHEEAGLALRAWIAPPSFARPGPRSIQIFLNGRAIRDRTLLHAVSAACRDVIPRDRYPVAFLFLAMDPRDVDVNVHPAKIEVRFLNQGKLHSLVETVVREALGQRDSAAPAVSLPLPPSPPAGAPAPEQRTFPLRGEEEPLTPRERVQEALREYLVRRAPSEEGAALPPARQGSGGGEPRPPEAPAEAAAPVAGDSGADAGDDGPFLQVHRSYIVRETASGIEIIDQHALAERLLYEEIRPRVEREGLTSQRLLIPLTFDLGGPSAALLEEHRDLFRRFGLEVDRFGPSTFAVHAIPAFLPDGEVRGFLEEALSHLAQEGTGGAAARLDGIAKRLACRGAVKAGSALHESEIRSLLRRARSLPGAPTCPHGRPAVVRLTLADLERSFGRR